MKKFFLSFFIIACTACTADTFPSSTTSPDSGDLVDSGTDADVPDSGVQDSGTQSDGGQSDASSSKETGAADAGPDAASSCTVTQNKMLYPPTTLDGEPIDDQSAWGTFSCPDSSEPSYRIPRDPDKGRCTDTEIENFYEAYMGTNASYPARQNFDSGSSACKSCLVTEYLAPGRSGPVLRTPEDHYILNVSACIYSLDPVHASCAKILYNYSVCKEQVCGCSASQGTSQNTYSQCFTRVDNPPTWEKSGDCHYARAGGTYARSTVAANQPGAACVTGTEKSRYTVTAKIQCGQ